MSASASLSVRYVVFHKPGPRWQEDVDFREQGEVGDHAGHYLKSREQGKLELGSHFLWHDAGGMMIPTRDVSQEEMETFAAADPAVQSGLLIYEGRPWFAAMEHT
jgi:uncharacterized protein